MTICGICVDNFSVEPSCTEPVWHSCFFASDYTSGIVATKCGHLFHYICLSTWFKNNSIGKCPYCSSKIQSNSVIKIYHDWDSGTIDKAGVHLQAEVTLYKAKYEQAKTALVNSDKSNRSLETSLNTLKRKSKELEDELLREQGKTLRSKTSLLQKEINLINKDGELNQALTCLELIRRVASRPDFSSSKLSFSSSLLYNSDHSAILQSVENMRDMFAYSIKRFSELCNKYSLEVEAHRKTQERLTIAQQLLASFLQTSPTLSSKDDASKLLELELEIAELTKKLKLMSSASLSILK